MSADMTPHESEAAEITGTAGRWIIPAVNYVDPVRSFCALCGRPIARKYWVVGEVEEGEKYCTPEHAARHTTYPIR